MTNKFEFTLGERMGKALRSSGITHKAMAEALGVTRQTTSNWVNDHTPPNKLALEKWAELTHVPIEWLANGTVPSDWKE